MKSYPIGAGSVACVMCNNKLHQNICEVSFLADKYNIEKSICTNVLKRKTNFNIY